MIPKASYRIAFPLLFGLLFGGPLSAQVYIMDGSDITACEGVFYDSGGPGGDYDALDNFVTTICSDNSSGTHIRLTFEPRIDLGFGDVLCIFDGPDTNAPTIECFTLFNDGSPVTVQASAANTSGCLTISFLSSLFFSGDGWSAEIECIPSCQPIVAEIDSTLPAMVPADSGFIDICPGDAVQFSADASFPQDGLIYDQDTATATFHWDFGDGNTATGRQLSHTFTEPGGYFVNLSVTDQQGCTNTNLAQVRVRVAPPIQIAGNSPGPGPICTGDSAGLSLSIDPLAPADLTISQDSAQFPSQNIESDSLPLPDGIGIPYQTSLSFFDFAPGQTLDDLQQLDAICINAEHSYLRDLEIRLTCPNGSSVVLQEHLGATGGPVFLGIPDEDDDLFPIPGQGFDYCWTPTATNGTMLAFADNNGLTTLPPGDYNSAEPLSNLLGCPLNGTWTLTVEDFLTLDNGFLFSWSLGFANSILPQSQLFSPGLADLTWTHAGGLLNAGPDSLLLQPPGPGLYPYRLTATDSFGCSADTLLFLEVLPDYDPACRQACNDNLIPNTDAVICRGDTANLFAFASADTALGQAVFTQLPNYAFGFANHPPANPYASVLPVDNVLPSILNEPAATIVSVCVDISTDWNEDIALFLQAPNGALLELSTGNGGDSDNYTGTCFTPLATVPITAGTPPFTGDFLPEGNWNTLSGTPINGDWTLLVSDAFDPSQFGTLNSWSITFQLDNQVTYSWSPNTDISCTDCPDPRVFPATSTWYTVETNDATGCQQSDSVFVQVIAPATPPQVSCAVTGPGEISFSWTGSSTQYEYNIISNGMPGGWTGPVTDPFLTLDGLQPEDEVTLQVRKYQDPTSLLCGDSIGSATCQIPPCMLTGSLPDPPVPVSCFGEADGSVFVSAMDSAGQVLYTLLPNGIQQSAGLFTNLAPGDYAVALEDELLCVDTVSFTISEPLELDASIQVDQPILCAGDSSGAISVNVFGGNGNPSFSWSFDPGLDVDSVAGLPAGTYSVTITDDRACRDSAQVNLLEPDSLRLNLSGANPTCFNQNDGQLSANAFGGTGQIDLQWSTGATSQSLANLPPGPYCVTATDANGCTLTQCDTLLGPPPLLVDTILVTDPTCSGESNGQITVIVEGGVDPYSYLWSDPLGQINPTATNLPAGSYSVAISDANGCTLNATASLTEPQPIQIDLDVTSVACRGDSTGQVIPAVSGGTAPYFFDWPNGSTDSILANIPAGSGLLTVSDVNGCLQQAGYTIGEPAEALQLQAEQLARGCFGQAQNTAQALANGGTSPYQFTWSNGDTGATVFPLDSLSYSVTATDANGCRLTDEVTLSDLEPITFLIQASKPTCPGDQDGSLGITIISGGAGSQLDDYTFSWNTGQTGSFIDSLAGNLTYSVTVTDTAGCTAERQRLLSDPLAITFEFATTPALCNGSEDGTATVQNIQGEYDTYDFLWDAAAGNQTTATATGLAAGAYSVTLTDEFGCAGSGSTVVSEPPPLAAIFESDDNDCFQGTEGRLTVAASGGVPGYTYRWSDGSQGPTAENLPAGEFWVSITDANGCLHTDTAFIEEPDPVTIELDIRNVTCFGGTDGIISIEALGGTPPYRYSLDDLNYSGANAMLALPADAYSVYVRDREDCVFNTEGPVTQPLPLIVDAGPPDTTLSLGDTAQLNGQALQAQGTVDFFWEAPYMGTLSCTACPDPMAFPQSTISYILTATDEAGCEGSDRIQVLVEKDRTVLVPTGFSPNGDNTNDRLLVHGREGTRILQFRIYDRWGELVFQDGDFEVNDTGRGWDGTFRGQPMNADVYLWRVEAEYPDGEQQAFQGQTTLIR